MQGPDWGVSDFWGFVVKVRQEDQVGYLLFKLRDLLESAQVRHVSDLVGKPVSVEFESNALKSWRILTEVL